MKKLLILSMFLLLSLPAISLAQTTGGGFVPIAPIPGLTQGATADVQGLAAFFNNLYIFLVGAAAVLAVVEIIIGGVQYATTDNVSKKSDGKTRIQQAILGLVLVLLPVLVFTIINPKILNLSISWQPIKLEQGTGFGAGTTGGTGTTATPPTTPGTYTILKDGTTFKQALSADSTGANKFIADKCSGLPVIQTSCLNNLQNSQGCASGTQVSCGQQTSSMTIYYWKYWCLGSLVWVPTAGCVGDRYVDVIPANKPAAQTFENSCAADGGKVWKAHEQSYYTLPVACAGVDTSTFQSYDSTKYGGYSCAYNEYYKCVANL